MDRNHVSWQNETRSHQADAGYHPGWCLCARRIDKEKEEGMSIMRQRLTLRVQKGHHLTMQVGPGSRQRSLLLLFSPGCAVLQSAFAQSQPSSAVLLPSCAALQAFYTALQPSCDSLQLSYDSLQQSCESLRPSCAALRPSLASLQPSVYKIQRSVPHSVAALQQGTSPNLALTLPWPTPVTGSSHGHSDATTW